VPDRIDQILAAYVGVIQRRYRLVIGLEAVATVALAVFTLMRLGVNMDNKKLLAPDLPFQKAAAEFGRYFPSLDDALLIVVDGETPELTRSSARALAARLRRDRATFRDVYVPGGDPFFLRNALLYRTPDELDDFADQMALLQPVIADLSRDPSIANLAALVRAGLRQQRREGSGATDWPAVLDRFGKATVRVFDEYPVSISWESLMVRGSALDPGKRQVIVVQPVLQFGKLLAAQKAIEEIRAAARDLSLVPERGVRVRITGNPALNYEEMLGLAWDIGFSSLFSFVLVTFLLYLALRVLRLVSAAAITLLVGLVWTAAFAAAAVGQLNVLSIAFGVLFIGLGVDFGIHLGMHCAEAMRRGASTTEATRGAVLDTGTALVLCALTTAIGFFAFVPTEYRGVAELGLIAGAGMFIILIQTFTLFPALLVALLGERPAGVRASLPLRLAPPRIVASHPGTIAAIALVLGVTAAAALPRLRFDSHVIEMRNPNTESVQAFEDLLARSGTSPWYIDALAPSLKQANALAKRMRELDAVQSAITLSDYVPADQAEKRDILADVAMLLEVPHGDKRHAELPVEDQIAALRELHRELSKGWLRKAQSPLGRSARQLRDRLGTFLARIQAEKDPGPALAELGRILLGGFPDQLERLRRALHPPPITLQNLPRELSERMLAPDGHARVQIFPRRNLDDNAELTRFVDEVRSVDPDATGVAVNVLEFGRATVQSLRQALLGAFAAITLLLLLMWRRITDTVLVLAPLLLGAALTGGSMVLIGMPFNFANVVVLPLLIGIGVDSGIHLVHVAHSGQSQEVLLKSVTARAVFFSALTTIASFGSLSFSAHRGVASMGTLLVMGMVIILTCNLIVLPALINLRRRIRR
jgi:hopanoid biosynthesis associated RND transporter like protein HpnN